MRRVSWANIYWHLLNPAVRGRTKAFVEVKDPSQIQFQFLATGLQYAS